jgi:hypothetical protein
MRASAGGPQAAAAAAEYVYSTYPTRPCLSVERKKKHGAVWEKPYPCLLVQCAHQRSTIRTLAGGQRVHIRTHTYKHRAVYRRPCPVLPSAVRAAIPFVVGKGKRVVHSSVGQGPGLGNTRTVLNRHVCTTLSARSSPAPQRPLAPRPQPAPPPCASPRHLLDTLPRNTLDAARSI